MWFKQNEQKSPQQPETPAPRPQQPAAVPPAPAPSAIQPPAQPVDTAPAVLSVAPSPAGIAAGASRITPGITLKGEISGREDLWIGGSVDGKLNLESGRIVVAASGKVHGEIEAREVVIEGKLDGNLRAAERLEVTATGVVRGDAAAPRVALHEGAAFNGSLEILRAGESRSLPQAGASSRTTVAPRSPRFQTAQAAGAAAAAGATPAPASNPGAAHEPPEKAAATAPSVTHRGIASDSSEHSE